jgi:hypothetical protein
VALPNQMYLGNAASRRKEALLRTSPISIRSAYAPREALAPLKAAGAGDARPRLRADHRNRSVPCCSRPSARREPTPCEGSTTRCPCAAPEAVPAAVFPDAELRMTGVREKRNVTMAVPARRRRCLHCTAEGRHAV